MCGLNLIIYIYHILKNSLLSLYIYIYIHCLQWTWLLNGSLLNDQWKGANRDNASNTWTYRFRRLRMKDVLHCKNFTKKNDAYFWFRICICTFLWQFTFGGTHVCLSFQLEAARNEEKERSEEERVSKKMWCTSSMWSGLSKDMWCTCSMRSGLQGTNLSNTLWTAGAR